ncbi:MAG: hypothetical protein CL398_05500 [Acidiferrobacteraceae bacterium]|nr:hypothetical protein [Acidiferrobacteraceae bacterium]
MAFLLASFTLPAHGKTIWHDWYVTNEINDNGQPIRPRNNIFNCSDRIYAVVSVKDIKHETHVLVVDWVDPAGRKRERTEHVFEYYGGRHTMWAWLTLHPPRGSIALRLLNPSVGMQDFIGLWTVTVSIDSSLIGKNKFEILC